MLWALTGLLLTIGGTLLKASITDVPWAWTPQTIPLHLLGVSYQIGAVLLVGCLGGKNAAVISQIAYLLLGLAGFEILTTAAEFTILASLALAICWVLFLGRGCADILRSKRRLA